jgi:hypothetical protein
MSWLKLEDGVMVNLDHIGSVEIMDLTKINGSSHECKVKLYPATGDGDTFTACQGSKSKCEDFISSLMDYVGGKQIYAFGVHGCECGCGCAATIREDFKVCDVCAEERHQYMVNFVTARQDSRDQRAKVIGRIIADGFGHTIKKDAA